MPTDDWPMKLITLTSGACRDSRSAISLTLSRYWENIITRLVEAAEEVEEEEDEDGAVGREVTVAEEHEDIDIKDAVEEEGCKLRKCSSTTCSSRFSLGWL